MLDEPLANLDLASQRATVHVLAKLNRELNMTIRWLRTISICSCRF